MATFPRLVNKQFNSPIGLYSQQNIQATLEKQNQVLEKQTQVLDNGAMGIDFNNPINSKPANLANSAVLRMLEEEEQRQRNGQPGTTRTLPPAPTGSVTGRTSKRPPSQGVGVQTFPKCSREANTAAAGLKRVAWPPPAEETNGEEAAHEAPVHRQAAPVKLQQSPALSRLIPFDAPAPQSRVYSPQPPSNSHFSPVTVPGKGHTNQGFSPLSPQPHTPIQSYPPPLPEAVSPGPKSSFVATSPKTFAPVTAQTYAPVPPPAGAAPIQPPFAAPNPAAKLFSPAQSAFAPVAPPSPSGFAPLSPQAFSPISPQTLGGQAPASSSPGAWAPSPTSFVAPTQNQFAEPPPATITLRPKAPVHQLPPPVVTSQPATNTFRGGVNMRGDQKWPPQNVKEAVEAENDARISLAKGPACRPRKVKRDYSQFFAQNALPHNYPGYRAPPGTQHFEDSTGQSQF